MSGKYWFEPVKRLYIKNCPAVCVLSSRVRAIVVRAWGVFFIKYIGNLPGLTNEFWQSMVFETGRVERPKFNCTSCGKTFCRNQFHLPGLLAHAYNVYVTHVIKHLKKEKLRDHMTVHTGFKPYEP